MNLKIIAMRQRGEGIERDGQYWSDDDKKILEKEFEARVGVSEIAIQLHRSENAVMQQIDHLKLYEKVKKKRHTKKKKGCLCPKCSMFLNCTGKECIHDV